MIGVDFDGADVDGFREGEDGEEEGEGDESDCYVIDDSPWMVDCDQTGEVSWRISDRKGGSILPRNDDST